MEKEMINNLEEIQKKALEEIQNIADLEEGTVDIQEKIRRLGEKKAEYLGKKSEIASVLGNMRVLEEDAKKVVGETVNRVRTEITTKIEENIHELEEKLVEEKMEKEYFDLTLPVEKNIGTLHPVDKVIEEQIEIFTQMGYEVVEGPEIETTHNIFDMLNTPEDHPARELQDTFYINDEMVLRSQTSAIQIRKMLEGKLPIKMICPGRVYRSDAVDATHSPVFHQLEGLVVGENVTMSDLKGTLETFVKKSLGENTKIRFRPHHFPYTEPSAEVDVTCFVCKGEGCSTCKKEGYIELLGCGMVHPKVLENCGIDSTKYSGFAFGFGIERIAMAKYGIKDLRLMYENDLRFLEQFK